MNLGSIPSLPALRHVVRKAHLLAQGRPLRLTLNQSLSVEGSRAVRLRSPQARAEGQSKTYYMYFVYIIECTDKSLYTGITNNLERRFNEHKTGIGGHYTSSKEVEKIVYTEEYPDRSSALKREAQIKGWRREKKLRLISNTY